jgi:hypothetical protein
MSQAIPSRPERPRPRPQQVAFTEHAAPDGKTTTDVLKFAGALSLFGGIVLAAILASASSDTDNPFAPVATVMAIAAFMQGVTFCALFSVIAIIAENLVAIRKNSAHLAGIRSNTAKELQMSIQQRSE